MNNITFVGNVGADVDVRTVDTKNGEKKVAEFSVADNQGKDRNPIWWRCSVWEGDLTFKFVTGSNDNGNFVHKGTHLMVSGKIEQSEKKPDREGTDRQYMSVRVLSVGYAGGGKSDSKDNTKSEGKTASDDGWR